MSTHPPDPRNEEAPTAGGRQGPTELLLRQSNGTQSLAQRPAAAPAVAEAAVELVKHGWVLVPFDAGTKGPRSRGWNRRENCVDDPKVAATFGGNFGAAWAYFGHCCIDIDSFKLAIPAFAARGMDLMRHWNWRGAVRIQRDNLDKGKLVFKVPANVDPLSLATRMFRGEGFELRCASGTGLTVQDVLPPSRHPDGSLYRWIGPGDWRDPPVLPPEILDFWLAQLAPRGARDTNPIGLAREDLLELLERIDPQCALDYNSWIEVGMALHHETRGHDAGLAIWDAWSEEHGGDKYKGTEDLDKHWRSFQVDHGDPVTIRSIERMADERGMAKEWEDLGPDVSSDAAEPEIEPTPQSDPPIGGKVADALEFRRDHELMNRPPLRWYVPGVLPASELVVVYGASGSGKSFLVYDLLAKVAAGLPWRGRKTRKARVARIIAEGAGGDRNRKLAYCAANGGALPGFLELYAAPDLAKDAPKIAKAIRAAGGVDILLIDTLAATSPGANESSSEDMGRIISECRKLHAATGATVVLVHHAGKDLTRGARGWSGLRAAADSEIEVSGDAVGRVMEITKCKDGETGERFPFRLVPVSLGSDEDGNLISSCVVEHLNLPVAPPPAVREPKGDVQRRVWETFRELTGGDGSITVHELRAEVVKRLATPEQGKRDTRAQRVSRAIDELTTQGFFELEEGVISWL